MTKKKQSPPKSDEFKDQDVKESTSSSEPTAKAPIDFENLTEKDQIKFLSKKIVELYNHENEITKKMNDLLKEREQQNPPSSRDTTVSPPAPAGSMVEGDYVDNSGVNWGSAASAKVVSRDEFAGSDKAKQTQQFGGVEGFLVKLFGSPEAAAQVTMKAIDALMNRGQNQTGMQMFQQIAMRDFLETHLETKMYHKAMMRTLFSQNKIDKSDMEAVESITNIMNDPLLDITKKMNTKT